MGETNRKMYNQRKILNVGYLKVSSSPITVEIMIFLVSFTLLTGKEKCRCNGNLTVCYSILTIKNFAVIARRQCYVCVIWMWLIRV